MFQTYAYIPTYAVKNFSLKYQIWFSAGSKGFEYYNSENNAVVLKKSRGVYYES